jgi:hypothetical protein
MRGLAALPEARLFAETPISQWSPAEHLDHTIKVSRAIAGVIADSAAPVQPTRMSFAGKLVLTFGWIPRGRGKAPERLRGTRATAEQLVTALDRLLATLGDLAAGDLAARTTATVPHPRFGAMTPSEGLRFAVVHNAHHLRIVRDVLKH